MNSQLLPISPSIEIDIDVLEEIHNDSDKILYKKYKTQSEPEIIEEYYSYNIEGKCTSIKTIKTYERVLT